MWHSPNFTSPLGGEDAEREAYAETAKGAAPQEGIIESQRFILGQEGSAPQPVASEEGGLVAAVVGMTVESQQSVEGCGAMDTEVASVAMAQVGSVTAPVEIEPFDMWSHKPVSCGGVGKDQGFIIGYRKGRGQGA